MRAESRESQRVLLSAVAATARCCSTQQSTLTELCPGKARDFSVKRSFTFFPRAMGLLQLLKSQFLCHLFICYVFVMSGLIVNLLQLCTLPLWLVDKQLARKVNIRLGYCVSSRKWKCSNTSLYGLWTWKTKSEMKSSQRLANWNWCPQDAMT